jgi:hypothetical protein
VPRQVIRMPGPGRTFLDLFSGGRAGPQPGRFTGEQIEHIRRTVRRTPEVMVKVTGGGRSVAAVAAHLGYISHHGELEIETDEAQPVSKDGQRALLRDWHLELSAGQYRMPKQSDTRARRIKLVHNIVLSMPAPTPPHKILAAAKVFAREKFGATYRYAMVLHTRQQHPHVHLVVKAEDEFGRRRLHIDKAMLREWRQDFARTMREQGVPANATSRSARGETKHALRDPAYRAIRGGRSDSIRAKARGIAKELSATGAIRDPARGGLLETRKAVITGWMGIAVTLDVQGEIVLAGDVRYFANHLPRVLTDRERLAEEFIRHIKARAPLQERREDKVRDHAIERTR